VGRPCSHFLRRIKKLIGQDTSAIDAVAALPIHGVSAHGTNLPTSAPQRFRPLLGDQLTVSGRFLDSRI
jgi:hypothetical protein